MNFPVSTHPPPPTGRTPALNTWRCFGTQQTDLEVNFRATARPTLVTSLLAASDTAHGDAGSYWLGQTVPHRTLGLLQLVATTESTSVFSIELQCQEARCREPAFEISVPLEALIKRQNDGDARMIEKSRNTTALFRPPTGHDQECWLHLPRTPQAFETMAGTLLIRDTLDDGWMEQAESILAELDPLTAFTVTCACPGCEAEASHPVDLEAYALARLLRHQTALINTVHRIAITYGWSEAEIMAIPEWRRTAYDRRIREATEEGGAW